MNADNHIVTAKAYVRPRAAGDKKIGGEAMLIKAEMAQAHALIAIAEYLRALAHPHGARRHTTDVEPSR